MNTLNVLPGPPPAAAAPPGPAGPPVLLDLQDAAEYCTRLGKGRRRGGVRRPMHKDTIRAWIRTGLCDGTVKLRSTRLGQQLYTRADWLDEFFEALKTAAGDGPPPPPSPTALRRRYDAARAANVAEGRG